MAGRGLDDLQRQPELLPGGRDQRRLLRTRRKAEIARGRLLRGVEDLDLQRLRCDEYILWIPALRKTAHRRELKLDHGARLNLLNVGWQLP